LILTKQPRTSSMSIDSMIPQKECPFAENTIGRHGGRGSSESRVAEPAEIVSRFAMVQWVFQDSSSYITSTSSEHRRGRSSHSVAMFFEVASTRPTHSVDRGAWKPWPIATPRSLFVACTERTLLNPFNYWSGNRVFHHRPALSIIIGTGWKRPTRSMSLASSTRAG
jgi:hypothetical protein